ncbi:hypothetical protein J6590_082932 [Homalodisca vitripennis]|nr:hypothetical protein J6590_082932 [Homalodisca vitripennis]
MEDRYITRQIGMIRPSSDCKGSPFKGGHGIMKEVNVPSNKSPKSLNLVNRGVHLVIDRTKDFWTVDQTVQKSIEEENILSHTPDTKSHLSEQSSNVIERRNHGIQTQVSVQPDEGISSGYGPCRQ